MDCNFQKLKKNNFSHVSGSLCDFFYNLAFDSFDFPAVTVVT
jgi:hypothetical protein